MKKHRIAGGGKSIAAVAWLLADPSRTQLQAAIRFGISQGAVSAQKTREDYAISWCKEHPEVLERMSAELLYNPTIGPRALASACGIAEEDARLALLGWEAQDARNKAATARPAAVDPVIEMRDRCAMLAETIGGEYGVHVAAAIRGLT